MLYLPRKESNEKGVEYRQQKNNRFLINLSEIVYYTAINGSVQWKNYFSLCEMTLRIC